jgi:DNA mismatch endonuclease, patch repair protein
MERRLFVLLVGGTFGKVPKGHVKRMKNIRSTGSKSTEKRFRALLVQAGVEGWRMNPKGLPGKPDFLFPESQVVVFLDGCYWHGCPRCGHIGKVNRKYWSAKIQGNKDRDARHTKQLTEEGYHVLRFWEHELAEAARQCIEAVRAAVAHGLSCATIPTGSSAGRRGNGRGEPPHRKKK